MDMSRSGSSASLQPHTSAQAGVDSSPASAHSVRVNRISATSSTSQQRSGRSSAASGAAGRLLPPVVVTPATGAANDVTHVALQKSASFATATVEMGRPSGDLTGMVCALAWYGKHYLDFNIINFNSLFF